MILCANKETGLSGLTITFMQYVHLHALYPVYMLYMYIHVCKPSSLSLFFPLWKVHY